MGALTAVQAQAAMHNLCVSGGLWGAETVAPFGEELGSLPSQSGLGMGGILKG